MTKYERIQYTPDEETEAAINELILELQEDKDMTLSRGQAVAHFVRQGVSEWKKKEGLTLP